jgi:hypothetical protein
VTFFSNPVLSRLLGLVLGFDFAGGSIGDFFGGSTPEASDT